METNDGSGYVEIEALVNVALAVERALIERLRAKGVLTDGDITAIHSRAGTRVHGDHQPHPTLDAALRFVLAVDPG